MKGKPARETISGRSISYLCDPKQIACSARMCVLKVNLKPVHMNKPPGS